MKTALGLLGGLAVAVLLYLGLSGSCGQQDPAQVQQEREEAARQVKVALAANDTLTQTVDSFRQAMADTAAAHRRAQQTHLASADAKNRRIAVLLAQKVRRDSLGRDSSPDFPVPPGLIAFDPLTSCEERYELRTEEATYLRLALAECDEAAAADSASAKFVYDSMSTANGRLARALVSSDSARVVEIERPRPCTRDLVVASVACWKVDVALVTLGVTTGVVIGVVVAK